MGSVARIGSYIITPNQAQALQADPYLLTLIIQQWLDREALTGKGSIPANRAELFNRFIDRLLLREQLATWDEASETVHDTPTGAHLRSALAALAWRYQSRRIAEAGAAGGDAGVLTARPIERSESTAHARGAQARR